MDSKLVPTLNIDVPDVSGGSLGAALDSGNRQVVDEEYIDHDVSEQPPLPVKSFITGVNQRLEDEPGFSLCEHLKLPVTNDLLDVGTNMDDVEKMHEQAAYTEVVGSTNIQEVHQELVFDSAKHLGHRATNDLHDVGTKMEGVVEVYEQAANTEVVGSPDGQEVELELVSDSTKHLEHRATNDFHNVGTNMEDEQEVHQELVSDTAKHLEHRATDDLHDVGTKMDDVEEVHEQAVNTEVVGSPDERKVDQELICDSKKHLEHRATSDFHEVGAKMEDVEEVHEQAAKTEVGVSSDKQELIQELVSDSAKHLENRAKNNLHDVGTNMEDIEETHDANTEVVWSLDEQEEDQELVSDSAKHLEHRATNDVHDVGTNKEDVKEIHEQAVNAEVVGSLDEQGVVGPELVSDSTKHQEHRATNDLHDVGSNMEDVEEVDKQAANTKVFRSSDEQEVDQELVSDSAKHLEHRATNNLHDVGTNMENVEEVHEQAANKEVAGSLDEQGGQEFISGSAKHLEHRTTNDLHDVCTKMENVEEIREQAANNFVVGSPDEQVNQQSVSDSAKPQKKEEKGVKHLSPKPGSLIKDCRVRYQLPSENEGEFAVFDLVWGKVKSHPWWPGQIFHPSDSSEKAMKYYKKDCYLVAYFGDRTFAWNDASVLKPFRNHFSQAERQNKTEAFQNAVSCALEEVTRRVELGLTCSCISEDAYNKIKYQIVENSGIREESSKREGVDRSTGADSLQPDKLAEYVKTLAVFPTSGFDRLELVIAKAQLLAYNQLRGCDALPGFQYYEGLLECNTDTLPGNQGLSDDKEPVTGVDGKKGAHKRKHNLKDIVYQRRKEKSMTNLMGESMYCLDGEFDSHEEDDIFLASPTAGSKRKGGEFLADDFTAPQNTKSISVAKVSRKTFSSPQQSFKVGECIRRVASQMTGSPLIVKDCSEESNKYAGDDADEVLESHNNTLTEDTPMSADQSSLDEMLLQLHLSAQNPMKRYCYFGEIIRFFTEFRNLAVTTQRQRMRKGSCRKKKSSVPVVGSPEKFEFDDRNDSYWKDMVVQDNAEVKPARRGRKRKDEQGVSADHQKPLQRKPRKYSKKKYHNGHESVPVPEMPAVDEKQLNLPAGLMMNFGEVNSVPSEVSLNKMFKRFGPLKESETEVDMQNSCARVVFKKRSDAEVAYSSAAMFNIFGSTLVNYQLNYTPLVSFGSSSLALTNGKEDAS